MLIADIYIICSPPIDEEMEPTHSTNSISIKMSKKNCKRQFEKKFWELLTSDSELCTTDILTDGNISQEEALHVLSQRPTVVHRREPRDWWINAYNPTFLCV